MFRTSGNHVDHIPTKFLVFAECSSHCSVCYNETECYECTQGYFLTENGECQSKTNYLSTYSIYMLWKGDEVKHESHTTRTSEWVIILWKSCELCLYMDISRVYQTSKISIPKTMNMISNDNLLSTSSCFYVIYYYWFDININVSCMILKVYIRNSNIRIGHSNT